MNVPTYHKSPISLCLVTNSTFNILPSFYWIWKEKKHILNHERLCLSHSFQHYIEPASAVISIFKCL